LNDQQNREQAELQALANKDPVDPYPDLRVMDPQELRDGDVLMMLGMGDFHGIPISWLIRFLDGGAYSHSAMVTLEDGKPMVWDHSKEWKLAPVSYEEGVGNHYWAHVYRLRKHGEAVGSERYPALPIVKVLDRHRGDPYEINFLILAGVIGVISQMPKDEDVRRLVKWVLFRLAELISVLIDSSDIKHDMLICTSVTGLAYWEALNTIPNDYALRADLDRHRGDDDPKDEDWDAAVEALMTQLRRIYNNLDEQIAARQEALRSGNSSWVDVGGPRLPANLVSPADLEFSNVLERVGKLEIPGAN